MTVVTLSRVEKLTANQTSEEESVDGKSDDLKREKEIIEALLYIPFLSEWDIQFQ